MSGPGPSNGHWRPEDYAWDPHRMVAQRVPEAAIQTGDSQSGADSDPKGEVGRRPPERRRRAGAEATASASDPDQATPSAVPKVLDTLHNTGGLKKKVPLYCQIDGCNKDLSKEKEYYQRYRVCEEHLKLTSLMKDGQPQRFCQQCGRFHLLTDFDGDKRSCRARLQLHNNRRRKRASSSEAKAARKAAVAAAREEPPPPKLVPRRNRTHLRRKRDTHDEGPAAEAEGQWEAEEDDRREATVSGSLGALGVGSGGDESEGNEGLAAEGQGGRTPYDREIAQMYKQYPPAIHQALASLQGLTPGSLGPRPSPLPAAHRQPPHPLLPDLPHDISAMYHSDTDRPMAQSNPAEMGVRMDVGEGNYNLLRYFSEPVKGMAPGMPSASHPFMPGLPYASSPAQDIQRYMSEPVKGLGVAPRPPYAHLSHAAAAAQFDVFGEELEAVDMAHYLAHMQNAGHRAPSPRRPPLRSPLQRHQSLERMSNGSPMGPGSGRPDARSLDSSFDPRAAAQGSLRSGSGARGDGMAGAPLDTRAASGLASGASLYKCASDPVYGVAAGMPQRHGSYGGVAPRPYADWGGGQAAMASRMLNQPGFGDLSTLGEDDNDEGPPLQFRAGPRPAYGMQPERQAAPPRPDPYLSRLGRGPEPSANPSTGALDRGQAHMAPSTLAGQLLQGMQQPEAALPHGMVASSGMHAYPRATNPANAFAVASSGYATNPANAFAAASSGYATNPANAFAAASTAPLHPSEPSAPAFRIGGLSTGFGSVSAAEHNASTPASSLPPLVRRARLPAEQDVGPDGHWTEEQIHRMQLKIMNQSPADLPLDMRDSLISMLQHQPTLLEGYIRPGCVHVTVDMVCRRSQLPSSPLMLLEAVERLTRSHAFWRRCDMLVQFPEAAAKVEMGRVRRIWVGSELQHQIPTLRVRGPGVALAQGDSKAANVLTVQCLAAGQATARPNARLRNETAGAALELEAATSAACTLLSSSTSSSTRLGSDQTCCADAVSGADQPRSIVQQAANTGMNQPRYVCALTSSGDDWSETQQDESQHHGPAADAEHAKHAELNGMQLLARFQGSFLVDEYLPPSGRAPMSQQQTQQEHGRQSMPGAQRNSLPLHLPAAPAAPTSCGLVWLEAEQNGFVSCPQPMVVVDDPAIYAELQVLQQAVSCGRLHRQAAEELLVRLGMLLQYGTMLTGKRSAAPVPLSAVEDPGTEAPLRCYLVRSAQIILAACEDQHWPALAAQVVPLLAGITHTGSRLASPPVVGFSGKGSDTVAPGSAAPQPAAQPGGPCSEAQHTQSAAQHAGHGDAIQLAPGPSTDTIVSGREEQHQDQDRLPIQHQQPWPCVSSDRRTLDGQQPEAAKAAVSATEVRRPLSPLRDPPAGPFHMWQAVTGWRGDAALEPMPAPHVFRLAALLGDQPALPSCVQQAVTVRSGDLPLGRVGHQVKSPAWVF